MPKRVRGISTLRAYNWKEHDPAIDLLRTARSDLQMKAAALAAKAGTKAFFAWENGTVKSPMHKTLASVVIGLGAKGIGYDQGGNPYLIWPHGAPPKRRG